jgi:CBS domain-containing protein
MLADSPYCFSTCSVPVVSPSDPVILTAKTMKAHRVNSVVVMTGAVLLGIITYILCKLFIYAAFQFSAITIYSVLTALH